MIRLMLWCLLGIGVWFCHANVCHTNVMGQDAPALAGAAERRNETVIRQTPLPVVVLSDTEGNPILSLPGGWSVTDLDAVYRILLSDRQDQVPPFIIRSVTATGTVADHYVETNVQIEIITSGDRPVRIPLGFKEGILPVEDQSGLPSFRYMGAGSALLTVDPQERQYVAIVTPRIPHASETGTLERSEHSLSLLLWFPLAGNGGNEKRLSLSFPQSNSSLFLFEVPMINVAASVMRGRGHLLDSQENIERQSTLLRIQGLHTDTEITWRKRETEIVDDRPVLLVERAVIDVRLDAETRSVAYDAVLPVSSATGSFDQLQIRLPQGSMLDREMADRYAVVGNYSVYSVEEVSGDSIVTIRFPQRTPGPVSIHLRAVQQFEEDTPDFRRTLAGFEVLNAERQTGTLSVSVLPLEMKPHWEPGRGIRRTEGVSSSAGSTGDTRFEFISQPFSLNVRVAAPQTRINVRPDYQFRINRGVISMNARLSYTVSGVRPDVLYLRLSDSQWHNWEFGTSSIVDTARVELDESGILTIPLRSSPTEGTFDIEFRAHRMIDTQAEQIYRLVLPIPRPELVTWSDPAMVTVVSAHNVEMLPTDQDTRGLTRLSRRAMPSLRIDTTDTQQEPFVYRTESPDAVFVADLIFHQQTISATMRTNVRLLEEHDQVTQTISYNASFALAERVYFLLPRTLDASGDVQVWWNNRTLELRETIAVAQDNVPDNWVRKMVQLPEPMFQFQLEFRYSPPPLAVADDDTVPFSLSLICPTGAGVSVTEHRIHLFMPSGYRVELQPESRPLWESFREPRRPSVSITEAFRSVQSPTRIALFISASERSISGTTIVERAWLQTWLTGNIRQDWATYLLRSTNDFVTLQLPPDSTREHRVSVQVNRQPILQPNISPTGMLTIPIAPEQYNRPIEVFVDYRYLFEMSDGEVSLILPDFANETLVQHMFWQVILHPNQHIIGSPAGWTLEYDWSWNGLFWWRVPSIRKNDLGFEADSQTVEAEMSRASQYVFSHLQPPPHVTLYVINRSWIILVSSSIALFIGLVLIYVPQSRYAGSLFGLGVVLLAVLFYQPPLVLLMLQAATFGIFLALGAGYVYRIFHRQKQWIPPAFPMFDEKSQPYLTPVPISQTVHEVIVDEETTGKRAGSSIINNRNGVPPNGS